MDAGLLDGLSLRPASIHILLLLFSGLLLPDSLLFTFCVSLNPRNEELKV